jgi:hypothetical protein
MQVNFEKIAPNLPPITEWKLSPPEGSITYMDVTGPVWDTIERQNDQIWLRVLLTGVVSSFVIGFALALIIS